MGTVYPPSYAPRFKVTVDGTEYPEYELITDIVVDTTIEGADHFELTLTNPFVHEHVSFDKLSWGTFKPEVGKKKKISIGMGYGENEGTPVFEGTIENIRKEFSPQEPPKVIVSGYGPTYQMMQGTVDDSWDKTPKLNEIVSDVTGRYGVSTKIDDAAKRSLRDIEHVQSENAYRYIKRFADKFGFEFFATVGQGYFRPKPAGDPPEPPVATLYYGESMESFSAELAKPDHGGIRIRYWDEKKEKEIVGEAKNDEPGDIEVYERQVESESEAKDMAEAMLDSAEVSGTIETFGVPSITAGKVIKVEGVGEKFAEKYYVTDATHRFGGEGYRMSIDVVKLK